MEELTEAVFVQIDSVRDVGLDSTYVDKVKEIRRREHEVNLKENGWWLSVLEWVDYHDVDPAVILDESIVEALTPEDVQVAAERWFDKSRYARFVLLPQPEDETETATEDGS